MTIRSRANDDSAVVAAMLRCVPVADSAKAGLLRLMAGPDRHYHNTGHIATLWRRHGALRRGTGMDAPALQPLLAAAIGWHDAIYVAGRQDNEVESAALWRQVAAGGGLDDAAVAWVAATITATADHLAPRAPCESPDSCALHWVLDLDLTPLGEPREEFERNTARLALEYAGIEPSDWTTRRLGFLRRLAACPLIYHSPAIAAAYEAQARANISRELAKGG
jgi:predicted metal-dependent HD superfamily phosphohydrolase